MFSTEILSIFHKFAHLELKNSGMGLSQYVLGFYPFLACYCYSWSSLPVSIFQCLYYVCFLSHQQRDGGEDKTVAY